MSEALDPFIQIATRLKAEAEEMGLTQVHFSVHPSLDGGDHYVQVAYCLNEEPSAVAPGPNVDTTDFDEIAKQLEGEIEDLVRKEETEKAETEKQRLKDFFKELSDPDKGIGLEDE
jgi:hypothetical protein